MSDAAAVNGGARAGAGRPPRGFATKRLTLRIEEGFLARVDRARMKIEAPKGITRAEFLRRGLAQLLGDLDAHPTAVFTPPVVEGRPVPFPLEIQADLHELALALIAAGRAQSMIDLVRGAGAFLAAKVGM